MKRTKHNLSHYHLTSMDMGQLVPVGCVEVLPGDSFQHQTSALLRVTPQLKPVMHPVAVHLKHFFVPYRLLWSGWEDFITGQSATPPPTISGAAHTEGTLQDYLGVYDDASNAYSALPVRAYNMIYNEYFRDQDLVTEVSEDSTSVQRVAWNKDYFTTARPWATKGSAITLPLGDSAPVKGIGGKTTSNTFSTSQTVYEAGETGATSFSTSKAMWDSASAGQTLMETDANGYPNVYADLSSATGMDIVEFREAFAKQRYQEARARYGSNYVDYLRYLGVRPSDARLQRPEYLGGGRQSVSFSEVLNTAANGGTDAIGEMGGHGIAAMRSNKYRRFFEEHGVVLTLMYVRPKAMYANGLHRKFTRTTKEDYFQRELQNIGAQEVLNKEVYAGHSAPDDTFGFSDRYAEYRTEPSRVSAEFRNSTSYDWHFGRIFSSDMALNQTFIECDPTKRVFAEQTQDSLWVMVNHSLQARRAVSKTAIGRIR